MDERDRIINDGAWVAKNLNGTLRHLDDIKHAVNVLNEAGLPLHTDPGLELDPKNWDQLIALYSAIIYTGRDEPVLDAGACEGTSAFLPALADCGFTSLTGCNIDQARDVFVERTGCPILYTYGDVTRLSFPTGTFGFVACLSVIEHGVDWCSFIREMQRVIRQGGHLFISTDYWTTPVDLYAGQAFGAPVHVFSRAEIKDMIEWATTIGGFELAGGANLDVGAPTVRWLGMDYTFLNLLLRRR